MPKSSAKLPNSLKNTNYNFKLAISLAKYKLDPVAEVLQIYYDGIQQNKLTG